MTFFSRGAVSALGIAILCSVLASSCKVIESTADTLAEATEGTAVSDALRGAARAAESFRPYSLAEEHYLGRSVAAEILSRYKVHPDASLQRYVNLVGLSVLAAPQAGKTLTGYHFIVDAIRAAAERMASSRTA